MNYSVKCGVPTRDYLVHARRILREGRGGGRRSTRKSGAIGFAEQFATVAPSCHAAEEKLHTTRTLGELILFTHRRAA